MQNVTILGITLQDRSFGESISAAMRFMQKGALDVISYVDQDVLSNAEHDGAVRRFIDESVMTLWEDKAILKIAGINDLKRIKEVEDRKFIRSLLDNLVSEERTVCVAGPDEISVSRLKDELLEIQPKLNIVHETFIADLSEVPENEINGINEHAPSLIIARMDYRKQQEWLSWAKPMINAGIWIAIPPRMAIINKHESGLFFLRKLFLKIKLRVFSIKARKHG